MPTRLERKCDAGKCGGSPYVCQKVSKFVTKRAVEFADLSGGVVGSNVMTAHLHLCPEHYHAWGRFIGQFRQLDYTEPSVTSQTSPCVQRSYMEQFISEYNAVFSTPLGRRRYGYSNG